MFYETLYGCFVRLEFYRSVVFKPKTQVRIPHAARLFGERNKLSIFAAPNK